ncbi:hypothetical protein VIGAN_08001600 [Vigna angularis var. angularis]|uniref:Uncharacterized protein n=1 Tax=Vigna angularis var. angularis TaxID=157739 RepID=A0A0S3SKW9_PHAAN|nr:hypothetical protein VIGAN_08001600 [Vigna angularis var. angularis]
MINAMVYPLFQKPEFHQGQKQSQPPHNYYPDLLGSQYAVQMIDLVKAFLGSELPLKLPSEEHQQHAGSTLLSECTVKPILC